MSVFSPATISGIEKQIADAASHFISLTSHTVKTRELADALVLPEHRETLREARRLTGQTHAHSTFAAHLPVVTYPENTPAEIQFAAAFMFDTLLPISIKKDGMHRYADPAFVESFNNWLAERLRIGMLFADAIDAIWLLNEECSDAGTFAFYFPAMPALLKRHAESTKRATSLNKTADALLAGRKLGKLPGIPRSAAPRIAEASALVTAALMALGDSPVPAKSDEARLWVRAWPMVMSPERVLRLVGRGTPRNPL